MLTDNVLVGFVALTLFGQVESFGVSRMDPVSIAKSRQLLRGRTEQRWKEEYFTGMPVDHFSFTDDRRFKLRYLINLKSYQPGGPIFFYTGNEGNIENFAENTGFMWDIAPLFNAAVVFAEHRFYGKTQPFGNDSFKDVKNLGHLSSTQALADFVDLIVWLKAQRIKGAHNSPVIAFGGSYGGMLAAWIRTKYPHIVDGAIAASAPVFWFRNANVSDEIFSKIVTRTFKNSGCNVETVAAAFDSLATLAKTPEGRKYLNKVFVLDPLSLIEKEEDGKFLIDFVSETMKSMAMVDYPYPSSFLADLPAWPVKESCRLLNRSRSASPYKNVWLLRRIVNLYYNYTGTTKSFCANPDKCGGAFDKLGAMQGWSWQACTEMVMPMCDSGLPNDFFPKTCPFTLEGALEYCRHMFVRVGFVPGMMRPDWVIDEYGAEFVGASNIVFSNGYLDPWSGGGWSLEEKREGSLVSIILQQGAHHYDLRAAHPDDTEEVKKVRLQEVDEIRKWVKKANRRNRRKDAIPN